MVEAFWCSHGKITFDATALSPLAALSSFTFQPEDAPNGSHCWRIMVDHAAAQQSSTKRLQSFLDAAKKAFDPARAESLRQEGQREYDALVERYCSARSRPGRS